MRVGIAHHLGWAVAVTASAEHRVVDRRRIELVEPGMAAAPVHHEGKSLPDAAFAELLAEVRASVHRASAAALEELAALGPIRSLSLCAWDPDFPQDLATQRRVPYEARADSVMYRTILDDVARARGWAVHLYDAKSVEAAAARVLGDRAHEVLHGPRAALGPPWAKDHRVALAATVLAGPDRSPA
ncbi:hypothetical protein GCM10009836_20160 [Pseudonocardia ailaonensis]|uniref:Uncharacterized protein n=1 Tax=Pseudonocardia ailaonensis TaxID=367279 RepID=A0ABN2MXX6_9PSEU